MMLCLTLLLICYDAYSGMSIYFPYFSKYLKVLILSLLGTRLEDFLFKFCLVTVLLYVPLTDSKKKGCLVTASANGSVLCHILHPVILPLL